MIEPPAIATHAVEVYTDTLKITGRLDVFPARRVSDALNEKEQSFLFLEEASIIVLGERDTASPTEVESIVVNKDEIVFVSALEEDFDVVSNPVWRRFHHIKKRPQRVVIRTPSFLIRGCIHLIEEVRLKDALDVIKQRFIAVTDATIIPLAEAGPIQREFVSVNIRKISVFYPEAPDQG